MKDKACNCIINMLISFFLTILIPFYCSASQEGSKKISPEGIQVHNSIEDEAEKHMLISLVEKWTDIATKNRLNADYVPGMVSVLEAKDLKALGIRTVWEGLTLIPGIDLSLERHGLIQTIVRGIVTVYAPINIKILLDGTPMTSVIGISPVVNMPIEQIERIEVIRGPGSAIHGEFALLGVINIVTRKQDNSIYGMTGSYDTYGGGSIISWADHMQRLKLSINLAGWSTQGSNVNTGPDTLWGMGMEEISNAPGPANEKMDYGAGFLSINYSDFSLDIRWMESGRGDFFGIGNALPPPDNRIIFKEQQWGMTATQKLDLTTSLHMNLLIDWQEQKFEGDNGYWYPTGFYIPFLQAYPEGWLYGFNYRERWFNAGIDITWQGWEDHTILFGGSFALVEVIDAWLESNVSLSSPIPLPLDHPEREYSDQKCRRIRSMVLQDEWRMTDKFTFTASLRYDHYNDIGEMISPRTAAVYRLARKHIIKAQYSQSFRPPTYFEMYAPTNPLLLSNLQLSPETIDTYELGYIYKGLHTIWRVTTFYSELKKKIYEDNASRLYKNTDDVINIEGLEIELEKTISSYLKLGANISYVDNEQSQGCQGALGADWLSNLNIFYQPCNNLTLGTCLRYVGEREREPLDQRDDMKEYYTLDITGTVFDLWLKGLTVRLGIKNIFDEDVRYPASIERYWPFTAPYPTYPEDFQRPGRRWWAQISYDF